jgi:hypothetical protein
MKIKPSKGYFLIKNFVLMNPWRVLEMPLIFGWPHPNIKNIIPKHGSNSGNGWKKIISHHFALQGINCEPAGTSRYPCHYRFQNVNLLIRPF